MIPLTNVRLLISLCCICYSAVQKLLLNAAEAWFWKCLFSLNAMVGWFKKFSFFLTQHLVIYVNHAVIYRFVTLFKAKRWNIICDWYYIALDTTQRNVRVSFYTIRHSTGLLLLFDPSAPTGPCFLLSHLGSIYACFLAAGIVILQSSSPRSAYIATFLAPGSTLSLDLLLPNKAGKDTRLVRLSDCMRSLLRG